jgi:hypothetical protein
MTRVRMPVRPLAWLVSLTLVAATLAGLASIASVPSSYADSQSAVSAAEAAALPPGGLVPSVTNFGWTQGEFEVSDDGAATYSMRLWTPTGRGTVTPQLALSYSSRAGNGPLGVGWELTGLPSITRCPKTRAVDGSSEKLQFDAAGALCLSGERLMPVTSGVPGQREFRTERDSFNRIVAFVSPAGVPDSFKVSTKDGGPVVRADPGLRARRPAAQGWDQGHARVGGRQGRGPQRQRSRRRVHAGRGRRAVAV